MRDVQLKPSERKTLERLLARRSAHAGHIRRARVILLSAEGVLARKFKLTSATVSKILPANGLKPHLVRTYKVSRDPEFAEKVKDIVGLYLCPPGKDGQLATRTTTSAMASWTCTRR